MPFLRVQLVDNPSDDALDTFWKYITAEPSIIGALSDYFPKTLAAFVQPTQQGTAHLYLGMCEGDVESAHWLHDWGVWGYPHAAFVGAWHRPDVRGQIGIKPQLETLYRAECELGITMLLTASRWSNVRSHALAMRLGFKYQGIFQDWV